MMEYRSKRVAMWSTVILVALLTWSARVSAAPTTTTTSTTSTTVATTTTTGPKITAPSVSATPNTGLSDLETVTVAGSGLVPDHDLNVAQCNVFNGKAGGVCYAPTRKSAVSDATGAFTTTFIVRRVINQTGSSVDCATAPATCGIIVGDGPHAVVAMLTFDPSLPANEPKVVAVPNAGLHDGDNVQITGTGFTPDEKVVIAQCAATTLGLVECDTTNEAIVDADQSGSFPATTFVVHSSITIPGRPGSLDCTPEALDAAPCVVVGANFVGASEFATAMITFVAPAALPRTGAASVPLGVLALTLLSAGTALVAGTRRRAPATSTK